MATHPAGKIAAVEHELTTLLAKVRQSLLNAGFDINTADPTDAGLYLTQDGKNVIIAWTPAAERIGMRDVIRTALVSVLTDDGLTATETETPNALCITGAATNRTHE